MYLRIEFQIEGARSATTMRVLAVNQRDDGMAVFRLDGAPDVWVLDIGNPFSRIPEDAIGEISMLGKGSPCPVYGIEMLESLDDEVRSIMSNYFQAEDQPTQPRTELPLPMMMGFDDDGE